MTQKEHLRLLLDRYEAYKHGDLRKIGEFHVSLEMHEINKFKNDELKELKAQLPASAFDYIKQLKKHRGGAAAMSDKSDAGGGGGFAYDQREIDSSR